MGRLVEHEATGPRKLDESDIDTEKGDIAVCQCGLSEEFPFCDGSHRRTSTEESDVCYRYVGEADHENETQARKKVDRVVYDDGTTEAFKNTSR